MQKRLAVAARSGAVFKMNFPFIFLAVVVCGSSVSAGNPPLTETEKFIANGVNSFAVNLLKILHDEAAAEENVLISPVNLYAGLALAHLGAAGSSRNELAKVMGLPQNDSLVTAIHESFSQISKKIQHKPKDQSAIVSEVTMANGIFVQQDCPIKKSYVQLMQSYYDGNATNVDFSKNPKAATDFINHWVSQKTKGRIPKLYSEPLDPLTTVVLANSLYFNGRWLDSFPAYKTKSEPFHIGPKKIQVQMMNHQNSVRYANNSLWQIEAIALPYNGGDIHMLVILPHHNQTLKNLTEHLNDVDKLHGIVMKSEVKEVEFKIPKMKFAWTGSLKKALAARGLTTIFDKADFGNMLSSTNVKLSDVNHATEITVDERGTKASAITVLPMQNNTFVLPQKADVKFIANRPFIVHIYYQPKHVMLFSGIVYKPAEK